MSLVDRLTAAVGSDRNPAADGDPYRCERCDTGFDVQYHVCPVCAGFRVDPTGW